MEERNNEELVLEDDDDVMLPGFRFHPTDEELVGFYLKMKIQQRPLCIELIRQLDIYKYDPWDLPKLAASGEKEWYFYCQRDRKYRNSAKPNRVTGAGFWKATGTDRPVYSSNCSSKSIIGLKKSLVFYKGRACKALKTDWMMHEFRDPSNVMDSWAICRIFKKTNVSRRGVSSTSKHEITYEPDVNRNGSVLCSKTVEDVVCNVSNDYLEGKLPQLSIPNEPIGGPSSFTAQPMGVADIDVSSLLLNMSASFVGDFGCRAPETSEPFSWFQSVGQPDGLAEQPMYGQDNALLFEDSKPWESAPPPSSIGHALSCIWDKLLN